MAGIINPYSDEAMRYDYDSHMYVLTAECVLAELNINLQEALNPTGAANVGQNPAAVLKQISFVVYSQMYDASCNNDIQEWLAAKAQSARRIIKDALKQQVLYFMFGGDLSQYNGVDIKKGRKMQDFSNRILSPNARRILERNLKETGKSLLYSGSYPELIGRADIGDYALGNY